MKEIEKTVENKRMELQKKLDEVNNFEDEVLEASGKLSLKTFEITPDLTIQEIISRRISAYDRRLFYQDKAIPGSIDKLGRGQYWWGQFECGVDFITTQQLSELYSKLPEMRRLFLEKIEEL